MPHARAKMPPASKIATSLKLCLLLLLLLQHLNMQTQTQTQTQTPRSSRTPRLFESSHSRWIALTHRTPSSHSSFLYGVKSTKIYCRPTCAARLARRANVVFYDTEEQARRDGFRPCKRCKPDDAGFVGAGEEVATRVMALLQTRQDGLEMRRGLKELAMEVGVTPSYVCRAFKKTMGVTVGAYMREFEREGPGKREMDGSVQSSNDLGSGVAITARSPLVPVDNLGGGLIEQVTGNVEGPLDFEFDFDEWFLMEDFLNSSNYK